MPAHTERHFEAAIEHRLISQGGYGKRAPADYAEERALFPADVCGFLRESQPGKWRSLEALHGTQTEATVLESLAKELKSKGTLHVLRHGFKHPHDVKLRLVMPIIPPVNAVHWADMDGIGEPQEMVREMRDGPHVLAQQTRPHPGEPVICCSKSAGVNCS